MTHEFWPALEVESWQDTRDTLHLWTQIVGKVRMALAPPVNHWWGVTLSRHRGPVSYTHLTLPTIYSV